MDAANDMSYTAEPDSASQRALNSLATSTASLAEAQRVRPAHGARPCR